MEHARLNMNEFLENCQYIFHQDPIEACLLVMLTCTVTAAAVCYILGFICLLLMGICKTIGFIRKLFI